VPVYELSAAGGPKTSRINYPTMNANNGLQFGAMVPIASYTASGSDFCQFLNIPQIYQDLMVVIYGRTANTSNGFGTAQLFGAYANGDASSCSATSLRGDGSSATSTRVTGQPQFSAGALPNGNATSGIFGSATMHILNYTNTTTFKTILTRSAFDMNGSGGTWLTASLYSKTPAITSLTIYDPAIAGNAFAAGSTATLYGIRTVAS
jgi:hypothetical protein